MGRPGLTPAEEASAAVEGSAVKRTPDKPLLEAMALADKKLPVSVKADGLEFDYRTRVLTYTGNVHVEQGELSLKADRLTLELQEDEHVALSSVVADGNVRVAKGDRWATAGHAEFDGKRRIVVLSKNAVLHEGPNQLSGERVLVYLDEERGVVEGGEGRVHAVLVPAADDDTDTAGEHTEVGKTVETP